MNPITDSYLFSHALEFRLLLALIIVPLTYAAIQITSFIVRSVGSILTKTNGLGSSGAYSAAGVR